MRYDNSTGICKVLGDCPKVIQDYKTLGTRPTICGQLRRKPIVCCPGARTQPRFQFSEVQKRISIRSECTNLMLSYQASIVLKFVECEEYNEHTTEKFIYNPTILNKTSSKSKCEWTEELIFEGRKTQNGEVSLL